MLVDEGILHNAGGTFHWTADDYPAQFVSLRTGTLDNIVIVTDESRPAGDRPGRSLLRANACARGRDLSPRRAPVSRQPPRLGAGQGLRRRGLGGALHRRQHERETWPCSTISSSRPTRRSGRSWGRGARYGPGPRSSRSCASATTTTSAGAPSTSLSRRCTRRRAGPGCGPELTETLSPRRDRIRPLGRAAPAAQRGGGPSHVRPARPGCRQRDQVAVHPGAHAVSLRPLSGRRGAQRAAVRDVRAGDAGRGGAGRRLRLRRGLPGLRGAASGRRASAPRRPRCGCCGRARACPLRRWLRRVLGPSPWNRLCKSLRHSREGGNPVPATRSSAYGRP